jgi:5'-nucleotidase/UDP-sugar diphosphatase
MPFDFFVIRREETLLGNALSDALRLYAKLDLMLLNAGAIRAGLNAAGNFSIGDVQRVLPLAATLTKLYMRGDVLLQVLENSVSRVGQLTGTGRFLVVRKANSKKTKRRGRERGERGLFG